jgi:hypothetical protein
MFATRKGSFGLSVKVFGERHHRGAPAAPAQGSDGALTKDIRAFGCSSNR